jgi:hypothetical protein
MSDPSSTATRLAFHGFIEPEATAPPGPDDGPAHLHRLHGRIPIAPGREWRITSQPARQNPSGFVSPARICIRHWHRGRDGNWWTERRNPGISIGSMHAEDFCRAVAAAVAALTGEPKP